MNQYELEATRSKLLVELSKMKRLGFFVVDEAFDIASTMDITECRGLPISIAAFIVSERGYTKFKSKL